MSFTEDLENWAKLYSLSFEFTWNGLETESKKWLFEIFPLEPKQLTESQLLQRREELLKALADHDIHYLTAGNQLTIYGDEEATLAQKVAQCLKDCHPTPIKAEDNSHTLKLPIKHASHAKQVKAGKAQKERYFIIE